MSNVRVKKTALMAFNVDLEVVRSCIDRIDIDVPIMSIFSEPTRVTVKGVRLEVMTKKSDKKKKRNFKIEEMGELKKVALKQTEASMLSRENMKIPEQNKDNIFLGLIYGVEVFVSNINLVYFDENEHMDIIRLELKANYFKINNFGGAGETSFSSKSIKKKVFVSKLSIGLDFLDQDVQPIYSGS